MSKRLSKEELESDPLLENYKRAADYYVANKSQIITIALALTIVIGGFFGYKYYSSVQEDQAQELLAIAETAYAQGNYEEALYGNDFELTYGFDQIAEEFPWTNAGNLANYYAAVSNFELGDVDNALMYMEEFEVPEGILGVGPLTFHAKLYLAKENYTAAAEKFMQAAGWNENEVTTPSNLYEAAQAYYKAENYERARELVNRVINEYPESTKLAESQRLKGMLVAQ
ncbi:MAG: tetratricopeptide repeat protein [Gracilimonas sp.]|uniref:tetratricopeptide repeat protein n=1 Tax=Gracilimonas sp. TaxID=1974203 RepID=UPI0037532BD2|nr:tetratricopeptide repeat protein [Gracilimonas sp.]